MKKGGKLYIKHARKEEMAVGKVYGGPQFGGLNKKWETKM